MQAKYGRGFGVWALGFRMIFFEELNSFREAALEVSKQKFYFCH